ncbi:UTP--glucose-1-phosphate uridylyltransferase [Mycena chlorophos]|uniref:UTP--glucose-1-phosphate uridylyltransferase n=1 Tax=Mycena chlorophos TaxID=658473 RepID=A0A8H6SVJ3_MYCCL|nr:UTP--glucose-1-phosphate uridylyltransferase [Mycena chlorophos]
MPLFKYRRLPRRKPQPKQGKSMQDEIAQLVDSVSDPAAQKAFNSEMQSFLRLFNRYMEEKDGGDKLNWSRIKSAERNIVQYDALSKDIDNALLRKLAVLKVNGGLGTSMGMVGAKSALEVRDGLTFLDLTIQQVSHLNTSLGVDVPLLLMSSFNTHADTLRIIRKYAAHNVRITTFNQSRYPRIHKDSLLPCPKSADLDAGDSNNNSAWYPPGHGDLYNALLHSGMLDQLIAEGKEYLFVSNADNLGAVVDQKILQHMADSKAEFIMEVTDKTRADVKGGTLIEYNGSTRLLEIAQVPPEHVDDFKSALRRILSSPTGLPLDIITNPKTTERGDSIIQLETAAGAAIKHFPASRAFGINVPRRRFLPVKTCADLLLVRSDLYTLQDGQLVPNPSRTFATTPVIQLGDQFKKVQHFLKRFKSIPSIVDLDLLTVVGDVYIGKRVTLRGQVIIIASEGQRITIPDGAVLSDRLVNGNLTVIEL